MPVVSIIIAAYGRSASLHRAVRSALRQTVTDLEVLIMCDHADPGFIARIDRADDRVRVLDLDRRAGAQYGPNSLGVRAAIAPYIAFLNHDDLWFPDHLERALAVMRHEGSDLHLGTAAFIQPWQVPRSRRASSDPADAAGRDEPRLHYAHLNGPTDIWRTAHRAFNVFEPASAWVVSRSLAMRVGDWRPPRRGQQPSVSDWLARAHRAGARISRDPTPTLAKVNLHHGHTGPSYASESLEHRMLERLLSLPSATLRAEVTADLARTPSQGVARRREQLEKGVLGARLRFLAFSIIGRRVLLGPSLRRIVRQTIARRSGRPMVGDRRPNGRTGERSGPFIPAARLSAREVRASLTDLAAGGVPAPPATLEGATSVRRIGASDCAAWVARDGGIHHRSGRFFSVLGVIADGEERVMIDQPEVGTLAFLVAPDPGGNRFLVQWKAEPGNVGPVQAAPTVQATRSNIDRAHGGLPTVLLDEVMAPSGRIADALGSEEADRFLAKENRNLVRIIAADEAARLAIDPSVHQWVSAPELLRMLRTDFLVNTDARSVLVSAPWELLLNGDRGLAPTFGETIGLDPDAVRRSLAERDPARVREVQRCLQEMHRARPAARRVPLERLRNFRHTPEAIVAADGSRAVGWFHCVLPSREVTEWCQPLLEQERPGRVTLAVAERAGRLLVGLRPTIGPGWTRAELGPTTQTDPLGSCTPQDDITAARRSTLARVRQSDEGGRFHASVIVHEIVDVGDRADDLGPDLLWSSLGELEDLARTGRSLTNELRSSLALLLAAIGVE